MPARNRGATLLVAGLLLACTRNPAPTGWLPPPRAALSDPYGAWIVAWSVSGAETGGELLAVGPDTVFVLTPDSVVRALPLDSVDQAVVAFFDSQWAVLAGWTAGGSLSTISNGGFLILTLPLWTIAGSLATGGQSRSPLRRVRSADDWPTVRMFARFPSGLPADLPRRLPPKPPPTR